MSVSIPLRSRLQFAPLAIVNDTEFWDLPDFSEKVSFEPRTDDVRYQVDDTDTIESLAFRFYRDTSLWWVIARKNLLIDLPAELVAGDVIVIPSSQFVFDVLFLDSGRLSQWLDH